MIYKFPCETIAVCGWVSQHSTLPPFVLKLWFFSHQSINISTVSVRVPLSLPLALHMYFLPSSFNFFFKLSWTSPLILSSHPFLSSLALSVKLLSSSVISFSFSFPLLYPPLCLTPPPPPLSQPPHFLFANSPHNVPIVSIFPPQKAETQDFYNPGYTQTLKHIGFHSLTLLLDIVGQCTQTTHKHTHARKHTLTHTLKQLQRSGRAQHKGWIESWCWVMCDCSRDGWFTGRQWMIPHQPLKHFHLHTEGPADTSLHVVLDRIQQKIE